MHGEGAQLALVPPLEEGKVCTKCEVWRPLSGFHRSGEGARRADCKKCNWDWRHRTLSAEDRAALQRRNQVKERAPEGTRYCPVCRDYRPVAEFPIRHGKPHGYCRSCKRGLDKARKQQHVIDTFGVGELERREAIRRKKANASPGNKVCARCLEEKQLKDFYTVKKAPDAYCKQCRGSVDKANRALSPRRQLVCLLGAARTRAKNKGRAYTVNIDDLVALWEAQQGRCWYTGVDLVYDGNRSSEALSIERVDSNKGYTKENVVLCCLAVNEMKSNRTVPEFLEWCCRVLNHAVDKNRDEPEERVNGR